MNLGVFCVLIFLLLIFEGIDARSYQEGHLTKEIIHQETCSTSKQLLRKVTCVVKAVSKEIFLIYSISWQSFFYLSRLRRNQLLEYLTQTIYVKMLT